MYEMYAHAKMLRVVIESNMRFGSDKTIIYVMNAVEGKEKNVQTLLVDIFGDKENEGLYGTKDEIDDAEDFFPYIYVPLIKFWLYGEIFCLDFECLINYVKGTRL